MREGAEQAVVCFPRGDDVRRGGRVAVDDLAGVEHIFPLGLRVEFFIGAVIVRLGLGRAQRVLIAQDAGLRGLRGFAGHVRPPRHGAPCGGGHRGGRTLYASARAVGQRFFNAAEAGGEAEESPSCRACGLGA